MAQQKPNGYGIASLVLGIIAIIFCWVPFLGLIAGILGLIFYSQQKKIQLNGMATGGLITSIIGLAFSVIYMLFWIFAFVIIGNAASTIGTLA